MSQRLKLGVIGTGMAWERLHYPALEKLADQYEITAMCDKDFNAVQKNGKKADLDQQKIYTDYHQMLEQEEFDAVDVLVPIEENYEVGKAVLEAGNHLIAEKPFASQVSSAKQLAELGEEQGLKVMVAENYRYDDCNVKIKALLENNTIGEVLYFMQSTYADFENQMSRDTFAATEWRQHPQYPGGVFLDSGVHDIARLQYLFGPVADVSAFGIPSDKDYCPYDMIHSVLTFENGTLGMYHFDTSHPDLKRYPIGLRIVGKKGTLYLKGKEQGVIELAFHDGTSQQVAFQPETGYYNELLNFYRVWNGTSTLKEPPRQEIQDIEVITRILKDLGEHSDYLS